MKKILLMLALMLPCLGVWSAVTKPESGVYVISGGTTSEPRGNLAACEGIADYPALSNITWAAHSSKSNPAIENGEHWYVYQVGEKYVIYNLGLDKYLVKSNDNKINFGEAPYLWDILVNPSNNNFNSIWDATSSYISFACGTKANGTGTRNVNFYTKSDDGGSLHTFTTVENGETTYAEDIAKVIAASPIVLSYELTDCFGDTYVGTYAGYSGVDAPVFSQLTVELTRWEDTKFVGTVTYPFPVSNASTKNQVTISPFQNDNFKYYVTGSDVKTTNSASVTNHLWEIYPSFTNGEFEFQIKNVATGKYISTSLESNTNPYQGNVTVTESEGTYFTLNSNNQFKVKGKNVYLSTHSSSSSDQYATVWESHDGTKNRITLVKTINLVNYILTDIDGNTYTAENVEGVAGVDPKFTGVEGYTLSNQSWSGNTFTATIDFNLPTHLTVSSETTTNLISIGQGTWASDEDADAYAKLWTVVGDNVKVVNGTPTLGAAQWMVYPTLTGTKFGFKIKSASTGKYVTANPESNADPKADNTPITLTENGTAFQFINTGIAGTNGFAYTNKGGTTLFITRNGEGDNNELLGVYGSSESHKGNGVRFPEFNQYQVVIGDAGYTTVYSPFTAITNDPNYNEENYEARNFVEIYTIADKAHYNEDTDEWKVNLTQASYYIPTNGAAILKGKGTYVFTKADDDFSSDTEIDTKWENNKLQGSSVNTYVKADAYVLSAPGGVENIGLYKAELNKDVYGATGTTHFLNNAGKAYILASDLKLPTTAGALRFSFGGETTAIESVLNNGADANAPIYDLSGRRVVNAVKGGIYIQNGKKFIVK